jgi:hypothetical protein
MPNKACNWTLGILRGAASGLARGLGSLSGVASCPTGMRGRGGWPAHWVRARIPMPAASMSAAAPDLLASSRHLLPAVPRGFARNCGCARMRPDATCSSTASIAKTFLARSMPTRTMAMDVPALAHATAVRTHAQQGFWQPAAACNKEPRVNAGTLLGLATAGAYCRRRTLHAPVVQLSHPFVLSRVASQPRSFVWTCHDS